MQKMNKKALKLPFLGKKGMIAIIIALGVIIIALTVLIILEANGVFYKDVDEAVTITPPEKADGKLYNDGDYQYALLKDGTAIITGYRGMGEEIVVIPEALGSYKVTAIGADVFALSLIEAKTVKVPEGVTYIGSRAFFGAENAALYLPSTIRQIDKNALEGFYSPIAIYYSGSSSDWERVAIGVGNKELAAIKFEK